MDSKLVFELSHDNLFLLSGSYISESFNLADYSEDLMVLFEIDFIRKVLHSNPQIKVLSEVDGSANHIIEFYSLDYFNFFCEKQFVTNNSDFKFSLHLLHEDLDIINNFWL